MTSKQGSAKAGPSNAYLRLLEGKISSKQYTQQVKRSTGKSLGRASLKRV
jgi:hypothetical protein